QVAPGDGGQNLRMRQTRRHPPLHRADVVQEALRQKILELPSGRDIVRELVEGADDRRRHGAVEPRPDRSGSQRFEELLDLRARLRRGGIRIRTAGGRDCREKIDLVDDVFVRIGLREVEPEEIEGDLLVLRPDLFEKPADEGRRNFPVDVPQLIRDGVQTRPQIADQRLDGLRRAGVDLRFDPADLFVKRIEVERVARLGGEKGLIDSAEKLMERPERLEALRQADVVLVEKLDSLDGHGFYRSVILARITVSPERVWACRSWLT